MCYSKKSKLNCVKRISTWKMCYKTNKKHTFLLLPSWRQLRDETLERHGDQYVSFIMEDEMEDGL